MKTALLSCVLVGVLISRVYTAILATEDDFVVDCGTDPLGHVSVKYTNKDPTTNKVLRMSSPKNKATCVATESSGVFTIADVRTNCEITQPDATKPEFWLQITLQEVEGLYLQSDPTFLFKCAYSVNNVTVTTVIDDAGSIGLPSVVTLEATGAPDMTYTLSIVDASQTKITTANFGDSVFLQVSMDATDADEQGLQVESCTVVSGTARVPIIEDFCVVPEKAAVFQLSGFATSGTEATFPITLFGLEGSDSTSLSFECVAKVCPSPCDGLNCKTTPAGKRKRRAAGDEPTEEKSLKMATQIQVLPIGVPISGSQTGQQDSNSMSCMQSLGFIVTVAVLAVLLLVAMVTVVFMFTTRRREAQKQGA